MLLQELVVQGVLKLEEQAQRHNNHLQELDITIPIAVPKV